MGMKIAVAGCDGFLGRNICSILERNGDEIVRIDLSQGIDFSAPGAADRVPKVDAFIHLANLLYVPKSYQEPELYYRVNYMTTLNALEVCRRDGAHLVYSSSYVYGAPQYLPIDEAHPVVPFNPYAQTKVICEKLCEGYHRDFGVPVSVMRPFNIYGEGQKGKLLIPEILDQLKAGEEVINLRSSHPRRDYIHVRDVAGAFCLCARLPEEYGVYNVCSGESLSVLEITEMINRHLKRKVRFCFSSSDRQNEVDETRGSYARLQALGWRPSIRFEEGIKGVLEYENL